MQRYLSKVVGITSAMLLLVYVASWIAMPRLGKSLEINFDKGCYTGTITWFNGMGSTCSSGGPDPIGFPFAIHRGPMLENFVTVALDLLPAAVLVGALAWAYYTKQGLPGEPKV